MYQSAKEFMEDYRKVFGPYEFKATHKNDKGEVVIQSKGWINMPPNLKEYKAIDLVLPDFLRIKKPQANKKDKKNIIKEATKYKEIL